MFSLAHGISPFHLPIRQSNYILIYYYEIPFPTEALQNLKLEQAERSLECPVKENNTVKS
jgi:hypothetical protein